MSVSRGPELMEKLVSLCKRRGFIYPGSEIYGGLANSWDYGPLGVEVKNNIKQMWWKMFVQRRGDMVGVDAALLMNPKVWVATGHVATFSDPLVECKSCNTRYRVDKLLEDLSGKTVAELNRRYKLELATKAKSFLIEERKKLLDEKNKFDEEFNLERQEMDKLIKWVENAKVGDKYSTSFDFEDFSKKIKGYEQERIHVSYDEVAAENAFRELSKLESGGTNMFYEILFKNKKINCPNCKQSNFGTPRQFNMMLKTWLGPAEDESAVVYMRPETAQAMFVDFKQVLETTRRRLPFGIAQIGKAFRNEITPGNFIFRQREFEQMEIEYFIRPEEWEMQFEHWLEQMKKWVAKLGIKPERLHYVEISDEDRAFYSKRTVDVEYDYPFGQKELYGLAYRTDYDLGKHEEHSGQELKYANPDDQKEKIVPHVIEPSFGVDRSVLAAMLEAYDEESAEDEMRIVMRFPYWMAPVKVAVLPLSKKPELSEPAKQLAQQLREADLVVEYDETQSIGKRYRRQDEIGTPFCVTFDFDSLVDNSVTIRDRDTMEQVRIPVAHLAEEIKKRLQ